MAQTIHLTLKLKNGGAIKGESTVASLNRKDTIECSSFKYGVVTPRETANAQITGRRQHSPIIINKRIDKSTPLLLKALCENDTIESAEFKFYRPSAGGEGQEEHYYTVKIEKGQISAINQNSHDAIMSGENAPPAMEEIQLVFQDVTYTYEIGGVQHTDSWSGK